MILSLLKKYGHEKDRCMAAILNYHSEHRGEWINKAALSLLQFTYVEKGARKHFSPETISRKARALAVLELLDRKEEGGTAWYRWPENGLTIQKFEYIPVIVNGYRMVRRVPVTETI